MSKESKIEFTLHYPFELNEKLNQNFSSQENISNFTSLLSDKDRFDSLLTNICNEKIILDELLGIKGIEKLKVFIIRAEIFSSCPEPLIIEYNVIPEIMILHLFKEIIKNTLGEHQIRCIDEIQQLTLICSTLLAFARKVDLKLKTTLEKYCEVIFNEEIDSLTKKGFEVALDSIYTQEISTDNTLVQIIEKSYEQLY